MVIFKTTTQAALPQIKIHYSAAILMLAIGCSSASTARACEDRDDGFNWVKPTTRPPSEGQPKGRHGANRVLYTPANARGGGVQATFSEPSMTVGSPHHDTKPTFYLGLKSGDARVTIDSGVQWENGEWDDGEASHDGWWSFFMNVASQGCHSAWNPRPPLKVPKSELGQTTLTLQIHPGNTEGGIDFVVSNLPIANLSERPVYWTKDDNGRVKVDGMTGRRVIGLTQAAGGPHYNDSIISCNATGGRMALITYQNATSTSPILVWDSWRGPDYKDAKDYIQGKARKDAGDNEQTEPWIVDFGTPFTRLGDVSGSHPTPTVLAARKLGATENDRYIAEAVIIKLLKPKAQLNRNDPPQPASSK